MASNVIHLDESSFDKVISSEKPVLVDFWAEWCGPCRMIGPILDELSVDYESKAIIAKVDVEENDGLAARFGITSIPNLKIFKKGVEVDNIVGAVPKTTLKAAIDKHL
ncbi:MAG: thioredoxin [Fibrobacter sp.]|nr:thioredoxin [Fibrobacter sp.]